MRFLSMVRTRETGQKPSERLMNEMGKLMDELFEEGKLIRTAGLRPTSEGIRLRSNHGQISRTDGPFSETKEVVGGYAIMEADSVSEMLELIERFLAVHGDEWDVECEIRRLDGDQEYAAEA